MERESVGTVRTEAGGAGLKYEDYKTAMENIRSRQPYSPENPTIPFARDLRIEIIDQMGFVDPSQYSHVRMYAAVGSAFDVYHGVDAFVEIDVDAKRTVRVTIDITTRNKETWKADICVELPSDNLDPDLDEDAYLTVIEKVAQAIVRKVNGEVQTQQYVA